MKSKLVKILIRCILAVMFVTLTFSTSKAATIKKVEGNTLGNIVNGGIAVSYGKYTFCRDNKGIVKIDNKNIVTRVVLGNPLSMSIKNDWIYYCDLSEDKIYKVKIDGKNKTKLADADANRVVLQGDYIYYSVISKNPGIYKINNDGSGKVKICSDAAGFLSIVDGWFYYSNKNDNWNLYKLKIDGNSKTKLGNAKGAFMHVIGDSIYYLSTENNYEVFMMKTDGSKKTSLNIHAAPYFLVDNGWIYFGNYYDKGYLYKIKVDGTQCTKLNCGVGCMGISVIGNWIYGNCDDSYVYRVQNDGKILQKIDTKLIQLNSDCNCSVQGSISEDLSGVILLVEYDPQKEYTNVVQESDLCISVKPDNKGNYKVSGIPKGHYYIFYNMGSSIYIQCKNDDDSALYFEVKENQNLVLKKIDKNKNI